MGVNNGAPTLLLNAVPDGVKAPAGFFAVNVNDKKAIKDRAVNPQAIISEIANDLKIGDRLRINFLYLGQRRWITSVTRLDSDKVTAAQSGNSDPVEENAMSFKVRGLRPIRVNGTPTMGFMATKGRLSWTFVIRSVANPETGRGKPATVSDPQMVERLKQFLPGEDVVIDYETSNYMFVIKDVRPVIISDTGRVINVAERSITNGRLGLSRVSCSQATVLGTKGTRYLVVRPADAALDGMPKASTGLAELVKGLQKNQTIQYKYYQQAGVRWLISAEVQDQAASRR